MAKCGQMVRNGIKECQSVARTADGSNTLYKSQIYPTILLHRQAFISRHCLTRLTRVSKTVFSSVPYKFNFFMIALIRSMEVG